MSARRDEPAGEGAGANDAAVDAAIDALVRAVGDARAGLDGIRPPDPARREAYAEVLARFAAERGGALYFPYLASGRGRGPWVELGDGSVKLDLITGIGVHWLGHGHPRLTRALVEAAVQDAVMQGNLQQHERSAGVVHRFLELAREGGAPLAHCFLTTSGAMANENALKIAFQRRAPADRILAFEGSFAGRTLALSQVNDKPAYREGLPTAALVDRLPFFDPADPGGSRERCLGALDDALGARPGAHAALILELVLGEGGFFPGDRDFFVAVLERARGAGVSVVVDEIQTFGRTNRPFAFQHFGLDALVDVVTVGKSTQVCATLFRDDHVPRPGLVSQTFTAPTSALFAAEVILDEMAGGGYFGPDGSIAALRARFVEHLERLAADGPGRVEGPFGLGAMIAFSVFGGDPDRTREFVHALFERGVIAFVAGSRDRPRVRFLPPPGALTVEHVDRAMAVVADTLADLEGRAGAEAT